MKQQYRNRVVTIEKDSPIHSFRVSENRKYFLVISGTLQEAIWNVNRFMNEQAYEIHYGTYGVATTEVKSIRLTYDE